LSQRKILGRVRKLRKSTISFVMSVRLSVYLSVCLCVHMDQIGSRWTDFLGIPYTSIMIYRKAVEKIHGLLKCRKNNG